MSDGDLKLRTKNFYFDVLRILKEIKKDIISVEIIRQIVRSSGSVSANCRAMYRGRSRKEYFAKLGIVVEESDECCLWLETLIKIQDEKNEELKLLLQEADELTAIFVSLHKRRNKHKN